MLAQIAILTALSVIVRRFLTPQVTGLNLGGFPLIVSGLVLGPMGGAYVGGLSDILGAALAPHGAFDPVYMLTAVLTAAVPALVLRSLGAPRTPSLGALMLAITVGQGLTKGLIQPFYRQMLTGIPWWIDASHGLLVQILHIPLYAWLAAQVLRALPPPRSTSGKP